MSKKGESVFLEKSKVEETLENAPVQGKHLLEPIKSLSAETGLPLNVLEDSEILDNEAEIHHHEADLWYCLEGEVDFVYGGEMVDPWFKELPDGTKDEREVKAKKIKGGTSRTLTPGDWLYIPAGQPHQHNCKGTARMVIIKVPKV